MEAAVPVHFLRYVTICEAVTFGSCSRAMTHAAALTYMHPRTIMVSYSLYSGLSNSGHLAGEIFRTWHGVRTLLKRALQKDLRIAEPQVVLDELLHGAELQTGSFDLERSSRRVSSHQEVAVACLSLHRDDIIAWLKQSRKIFLCPTPRKQQALT